MNRKPRPLSLSRKTLRSLTTSDLAQANGGLPTGAGHSTVACSENVLCNSDMAICTQSHKQVICLSGEC